MGNYIDGKSDAARSADKIVNAIAKQKFPWVQTLVSGIIGGILVGVAVWTLQTHFHKKALAEGVANTIAVAIANDLSISPGVSESMRERVAKREFRTDPGMFESIYSPTVELPSPIDVAALDPEVTSALDTYRRRLSECAKHRNTYLVELRSDGRQGTLQGVLFAYCVGLDSTVLSGFLLAEELQTHYPITSELLKKIPSYRPLDRDMQRLQEAMNAPLARKKMPPAEQDEPTVPPEDTPSGHSNVR